MLRQQTALINIQPCSLQHFQAFNVSGIFSCGVAGKYPATKEALTLSWLVLDPHTLEMFGKMSDQPAEVQFLLMFPARGPQEQPIILQKEHSKSRRFLSSWRGEKGIIKAQQ